MTDINSQTLHVVAKELAATLNEARAALETYAERPEQIELLQRCGEHLHQAHGVLRLVEVYGAALLAEEMEHVTAHLLDIDSEKKQQAEGLDALMRSMVQLPTYLERVLSGGRDLALILLPLLNDLRAVRGSPLLSEGTLLLLNLKSDQPAQPQTARPGEPPLSITQWARRLRTRFQLGLLGLIRGERIEQNLESMAKVAEKFEQVATTQPVFQLWWVTGALLEALRANGLESSATIKRLLGQADRQIKRLYEIGEARFCESPPIDLLNNMLYYVARATTSGGRIGAVRASFKLVDLLPVDSDIEQERESLSAPSVKLMHTVADAIKEDLSKVKDVLDIFVRRGGGQLEELTPQLDLLKKISETLGVLGLGELRQRVQHETGELAASIGEGHTPTEDALLKMAATLLAVEDSLDDQLVRLILPNAGGDSGPQTGDDMDFKSVTEAVLRECIVNLARVKEAVSVAVNRPGDSLQQGLDNVPQLLRGITAGLLMLGKGRAVELMDAIGTHVRKLVEPGAPTPDPARLERIADAIVSVEYYMETLQSGRSDPWYMLDNAEICIKALQEQSTQVPIIVAPAVADPAHTVKLDVAPVLPAADVHDATIALTPPVVAVPSPPPMAAEHMDPEFLELFIEEAKEEITSIQTIFPMWDQNPMDSESLITLRRAFHTLKGSGRMVGARLIGEFGWSIENLFNRLIDKTLTRTPGIMAMMRSAVAALPGLVEQLETGRPLASPVEPIMARAYAYAEGRDPDQAVTQLAEERAPAGGEFVAAKAAQNVPVAAAVQPEAVQEESAVEASAAAPPGSEPGIAADGDFGAPITADEAAPAPHFEPAGDETRISAPPPAEWIFPESGDVAPVSEAAESSSAAAETTAFEPAAPAVADMDPMLHDIYSKETEGHLLVIRDYLRKRMGQPSPHDLPENVYRAIHTLSGSSKMAEARHGIRITEPLNHFMRKVFDNNRGLSDAGLMALHDSVAAIDNVVAHINEATAFFSEQPSLVQRFQVLEAELDAELDAELAREASSNNGHAPTHEPFEPEHSFVPPSTAQAEPLDFELFAEPEPPQSPYHETAAAADPSGAPAPEMPSGEPGYLDSAPEQTPYHEPPYGAPSYSPSAPEPMPDHESVSGESAPDRTPYGEPTFGEPVFGEAMHTESPYAQSEPAEGPYADVASPPPAHDDAPRAEIEPYPASPTESVVPETAPTEIAPQTPLTEAAANEEFDSEIAGIYSEEASELLEAAEVSLSGWNQDRNDRSKFAELQRQLHTLKGGARMAGVTAMGNLSHELESLVVDIDAGLVASDDRALEILQASLDELARMRDMLSAGMRVPAAGDLIGRIRMLTGAESSAARDEAMSGELAPMPPESIRTAAPFGARNEEAAPAQPEPRAWDFSATPRAEPPAPRIEIAAAASASEQPADALEHSLEPRAFHDDSLRSSLEQSGMATPPILPGRETVQPERAEMARVDADLLDTMLNNAGEVSIFRARLDQQVSSIDFNLAELARTVIRLKEQLRGLEIETEAQVLNRHEDIAPRHTDFDPLELDRYSTLQQFSRALSETSSDVASIQGLLEALTREAQNLLIQQARVITELQNGLMRTRMVPFQRHVQRLSRLVRQAANDTHKRAELAVEGAAAELDRQVLERMVPPLEHLLRNAVVHGIETPERRIVAGKPEVGRISISIERDGAEVVIVVADDGSGINVKLIREKALSLGLADPNHKLTDEEAMQLILEPGFSTAGRVTQAAGRGVGMDVVATEVKKLGGGLFIESTHGRGSRFTIRLPFTLAISQALIVRVAEEVYALPLATVEGVVRLPKTIVARHLGKDAPLFEYGAQRYRFQQLGSFVGLGATPLPEADVSMSVVLIRAGEHSTALVTDELVGSREIVVKSLGPQISAVRGIAGATILGDGRIVVILDMGALVRSEWRAKAAETVVISHRDRRTFALVVDDSITVRRVTQRLLERNGMRVITAKDGVDAVSVLQEHLPDVILLDIEMPRMDGYEVAAHVRNDPRLKDIPIVMITSRVSEKHRARAIEIGVDDYLGKPYQENQLLDAIEPLVHRRRAVAQERG